MKVIRKIGMFFLIGLLLLGSMGYAIGVETTESVHFNELIKLLPDAPSGWEGEEPEGMMYTIEDGSWSMAVKEFSKSGSEDITADVGIMDSAFYRGVGWWATWDIFMEWESTEGYAKSTTVKGYPAREFHSKESNDYSLYVGINDRFMVFINTNSDKDTLDEFADSINYDKIAGLGGGSSPSMPTVTDDEDEEPAQPTQTTGGEGTPGTQTTGGADTPGFEAVFAIAGLLAVAFILKRRR
ncbi:MAG: PGF-CTERM sorting domain-containing protein [Halobacteriota archaeon]|nr:PGF-CTERM sorting domain-containing protein [Halobacteriota archaeon]